VGELERRAGEAGRSGTATAWGGHVRLARASEAAAVGWSRGGSGNTPTLAFLCSLLLFPGFLGWLSRPDFF
jgi:hypothetical protein